MGRTSTLPTILTTAQRYKLFSKYAIGKSLFVIQPAEIQLLMSIVESHSMYNSDIREYYSMYDSDIAENYSRGARAPIKTQAAKRPIFFF